MGTIEFLARKSGGGRKSGRGGGRGMNNNKEGIRPCFRKRAVKGATLTIPKGLAAR